MVAVRLLKGYRNLREGEIAGFEEAEADAMVKAEIATIVKKDVPETAGLGADGVVKTCPHCKEEFVIEANGRVRAERAIDRKPAHAEKRAS